MAVELAHRLEPGWTYWLTVDEGPRVRIDWSEAAMHVHLPDMDATVAAFPTNHGWVRVLDSDVTVQVGTTLTLQIEDADGNGRRCVLGVVQDLAHSSEKRLPTSIWGR